MAQTKAQKHIPFWENIFSRANRTKETSEFDFIKKVPLFQDLGKRELDIVLKILYPRNYEAGEFIFETGQPGAAMFVIKEGIVNITRLSKTNEEMILAELGNGDFVGELALLDSSPRSASAYVVSPTLAFAIFRSDLDTLIDNYPKLGSKVLRRLSSVIGTRLKATNDLLINLEEKNVVE